MEASSKPNENTRLRPVKAGARARHFKRPLPLESYTRRLFQEEAAELLSVIGDAPTLAEARDLLSEAVLSQRIQNSMTRGATWNCRVDRVRDCARVLLIILSARSDVRTGFSAAQALWDIAQGRPRTDLGPGFYAELTHLVWGLEGRTRDTSPEDSLLLDEDIRGREAAVIRSAELDRLWGHVERRMQSYPHGLSDEATRHRRKRRDAVLERLGGSEADWHDWRWQLVNVARDATAIEALVELTNEERENIATTCDNRIPFGVTPFYLSLMDEPGGERDRAIRAQVFPPTRYVRSMIGSKERRHEAFDFMGEHDTSPVDLITRRYPGIAILKPYNTCPQICVYCQRNWEIDEVLAPEAMAPWPKIQAAVDWLADHPAIHEVLITGGDPLLLEDEDLERLLGMVAALPSVSRIRIGTRTPVTVPMRLTDSLAELLSRFRESGRREVAVVTHVQHPYEVNEDMAAGVERLRRRGIPVLNQLVYTFHVSRRFEASALRMLLRKLGISPYYTFLPKGKAETDDYRVPLSRLLQEQAEEARLLPGLTRTDEAVYNVPRLGKNYLKASQQRDLLTIDNNGSRIYEFHPWEKNILEQTSYVGDVVPVWDYLQRLQQVGEHTEHYESIWYYY